MRREATLTLTTVKACTWFSDLVNFRWFSDHVKFRCQNLLFFKRDQSIYVRNHARYCNHRPHPDTTIPSSEHTMCGYMVYWTGSVPPVKVTLHESTRWGAPLPFSFLLVRKIISCANATICRFILFIYLFSFIFLIRKVQEHSVSPG